MRRSVMTIRSSENSFVIESDGKTFTVLEYVNDTDCYEHQDVFTTIEAAEEYARKQLRIVISQCDYYDYGFKDGY